MCVVPTAVVMVAWYVLRIFHVCVTRTRQSGMKEDQWSLHGIVVFTCSMSPVVLKVRASEELI